MAGRELCLTEEMSSVVLEKLCMNKGLFLQTLSLEPLMVVKAWIQIGEQLDLFNEDRKKCACCNIEWQELSGSIWGVITNKGSKIICDACHMKILNVVGTFVYDYRPCFSNELEASFRIIDGDLLREGENYTEDELARVEFFIDRWRRHINYIRFSSK